MCVFFFYYANLGDYILSKGQILRFFSAFSGPEGNLPGMRGFGVSPGRESGKTNLNLKITFR